MFFFSSFITVFYSFFSSFFPNVLITHFFGNNKKCVTGTQGIFDWFEVKQFKVLQMGTTEDVNNWKHSHNIVEDSKGIVSEEEVKKLVKKK